MSSSVPSFTFDQVFNFNAREDTTNKYEYEKELDQTFMNIDTDYKTIGLREIRVIPDSFYLSFKIEYEVQDKPPVQPNPSNEPPIAGEPATYKLLRILMINIYLNIYVITRWIHPKD
jgi:hypothetical protein